MRRVLCFLYYFPPSGGPGVLRGLKFVRYLRESGYEPIVVTVEGSTFRNPGEYPMDEGLLDEVPEGIEVVRVPSREPVALKKLLVRIRLMRLVQFVAYPLFWERQALWPSAALAAVRRLGLASRAELAYTCCGPYASNLIGLWLRRHHGLPWVTDHRDPFCGSWALRWPSVAHHRASLRLEDTVLRRASRFIANTPGQRRELLDRLPSADPDRIDVVTNGYDESDFAGAGSQSDPEDIVVLHAGSFADRGVTRTRGVRRWLREEVEYRNRYYDLSPHSPVVLYRALAHLKQTHPDVYKHVRFDVVGEVVPVWQDRARELGVADRVRFLGYKGHAETIQRMISADALYLPTLARTDGRPVSVVSQKLYEYLRAGPPILAVTGNGDTRNFVAGSGAGICFFHGDTTAVAEFLFELRKRKEDGEPPRLGRDTAYIRRFDRRALTQQLARCFDLAIALESTAG